jgi:enamine deaminase RidA (YjgF/YER057c/UK114 family)
MSQNMVKPIPHGKYLPAVRHADLIYTSGMTPRKAGILIYSGKIRASQAGWACGLSYKDFKQWHTIADHT